MNAPRSTAAIPRVAIYARCSADKQAERDLSIPAQLDACRAGAAQRGWEVVAEYVDAAESATTDDRPQFREMIAAAKQKPAPFETIVVWKFSRFSRNQEGFSAGLGARSATRARPRTPGWTKSLTRAPPPPPLWGNQARLSAAARGGPGRVG